MIASALRIWLAACRNHVSLIVSAKMNDIDPQAWLADLLARIAGHPAQHLDHLLLWHWAAFKASAVNRAA
jgi:transposase